jgi:nucleotide-binding universal stress UspA family protein
MTARSQVQIVQSKGVIMKPIVVGVDGSDCSSFALDFAAEEAALRGMPLRIVCAWDLPEAAYAVSAYPKEVLKELLERVEDEAKAVAAEAQARVAELRPALTVKTKVIKGHATYVILEEAKDAALVVVGNRGRGGVASLLLGSVSHAVVHLAQCAVVVVRAPAC